ncbi:MAG: fibronectin type III domain-containing protein [Candidatus Sumerlaeia bacterium]
MAKLRLTHLLTAVIAICLFQTTALAYVTVSFSSPANGATVMPGASIYVEATAMCDNNFLYFCEIDAGSTIINSHAFGTYDFQYYWLGSATYTVPTNAAPGTVISFSIYAMQYGGDMTVYTRTIYVTVGGVDTSAPTYSGTAGIKSVERVDGASADIEWYQATDNVTSAANIDYEIYYDTVQANVFTAGVKKTVTGSLTTTITGLNATSAYYVGVRAVDAADNRETNSRTLLLDLPINAVGPDAWAMYE